MFDLIFTLLSKGGAVCFSALWDGVWNLISSPIAIGIYSLVLLAAIVILISFVLEGEREKPDPELLQDCIDRLNELNRLAGVRDGSITVSVESPEGNGATGKKEEEEEEERAPRFYGLSETDARMANRREPEYNDEIGFEELCERFRKFCASRMKLYYDISDVRRFVASFSVTHLIVMQGMSGTGKTSLAYAFGEFIQNHSVIVPIQPMWKERTDLIGYYNEFTKRFNETTLLQKMYEANYNKEIYVTVLDEMNIARVEYYFAEFLSLLEIPDPNKRYLDVVSDKWDNDPKLLVDGKIRLPMNMWFMGTVNNDDSTFAISDKVYDRAMVMNLDYKCEPFECEDTPLTKISSEHWEKLTAEAREEYVITDRNLRRIAKLDEYLIENFRITFGNRIMKQIKGYVPVCIACGGSELDAIDDILSKKVLRKLEAQNPVYVKSMAEPLCTFLDDLFGVDRMPLCKAYLHLLERNA
ncbi:MAG: AAA family ATPase [Clostridia bacterium]|nr:AAA family ATPase [Clostridia bacterium]